MFACYDFYHFSGSDHVAKCLKMSPELFLSCLKQVIITSGYRVSNHPDEQALEDDLKISEICYSVKNGEVIEEYADDFPFPSCLVYGCCSNNSPVHRVWAYNENNASAVLMTVYRLSPEKWIDFKQRR